MSGAVDRLVREFSDRLDREPVLQVAEDAYDKLAAKATTTAFLPLLAERFARQQLQAIVRSGDSSPKKVPSALFLCVHNAGRSQMALGWFQHLAGDRAVAWSGGSEPGHEINPAAIAAMAEVGIDITHATPRRWTPELLEVTDVVITMGCGDECPYVPGTRYIDWPVPDPAGRSLETVRSIRDDVEARVRALIAELDS
jgi:protein-tyrosine-phosphatase